MLRRIFSAVLATAMTSTAFARPLQEDLLVTHSCKPAQACSFSWTLPSMASVAFDMAQQRIGPRDPRYLLLGIEFSADGPPLIWYPGNGDYVVIQLTASAMNDRRQALFQLGHEVLHVTTPTPGPVNILEEGLATELSLDFARRMGESLDDSYIGDGRYLGALKALRCLRGLQPDLNQKVQALRAGGHQLGTVSAEVLTRYLDRTPAMLSAAFTGTLDELAVLQSQLDKVCPGKR